MEKGYEDLYIAIWRQAIQDETTKAVEKVYGYAFLNAYADYYNATVEPLADDSKEIKKIKRAIRDKAKELCEARVLPRIKELIMAETREWPDNQNKIIKDPECKKMVAGLKKEVLAYAREWLGEIKGGGQNETICLAEVNNRVIAGD